MWDSARRANVRVPLGMEGPLSVSCSGRLGVCFSTHEGKAALLAWNTVALLREAGAEKGRNRQTRFLSHFPSHVWDFIECEWRESEGCAGVATPREPEGHDERLGAGRRSSEARGSKQFGQASEKRLRSGSQIKLSGSNWIMKTNDDFAELLYFVGVPSQLGLNGQRMDRNLTLEPDFRDLRRMLERYAF